MKIDENSGFVYGIGRIIMEQSKVLPEEKTSRRGYWKSAIAFLLCIIMLLSVSSCTGGEKPSDDGSSYCPRN